MDTRSTNPAILTEPTDEDVLKAAQVLQGVAYHTPVMTSSSINQLCGVDLFFKCEHLQRTGSFKFRGAYNAIANFPKQARAVAAHSSGNHALAIAGAAHLHGIPAFVIMPEDVSQSRRAAVSGYDASVITCEPTLSAREHTTAKIAAREGAVVIHPFESSPAIAGYGTAVLELLEEVDDLDMILVPVGGGGLAAGSILASLANGRGVRILAVEPSLAADSSHALNFGRLLPSADPDTLADGLRSSLGKLPFSILARSLSSILTADEPAIITAMRLIWERLKQVVEPSGAICLAAILENPQKFTGLKVGIMLSGGNIDLDNIPWMD